MDRLVLSDDQWERIAPLIIGRPDQKGSTGRDNRMFVEGVLWIVRTGWPWRDLHEVFGDWNTVFRRFSRWSAKGVWWRMFEALSDDPDFEYLIVGKLDTGSKALASHQTFITNLQNTIDVGVSNLVDADPAGFSARSSFDVCGRPLARSRSRATAHAGAASWMLQVEGKGCAASPGRPG
jgi:putative transposase